MRTMKHLMILLLLSIGFSLQAQVEFKTEVSKDAVMKGEPFKVEYTVNKNFDDFNLTNKKDFEIISGPSTSMQQSINMSNGKIEKTVSVTYTYFIKAKISGKQNVPVAEVKIHGKYYYSDNKNIIVIDAEYHDPHQNEVKDIEGTSKL